MRFLAVRRIDKMGRIVLPSEIRSAFNWTEKIEIVITQSEDRLVLKKFQESCYLCGNEEEIILVRERFICRACINEINYKIDKK
ncbi:MAG: hypothetical protein A2Y15_01625 [Clostridiales bacterium GWF2_36_10]|nr:MAG: hypothetical protein A2Y15_01625 [Clostridiales bacterium GWF2_36_10]